MFHSASHRIVWDHDVLDGHHMTAPATPDRALPDAAITFVLGDIEGSSRLWEKHHAAMPAVIARLGAIVDDEVAVQGGSRPLEQGEGDSFVASFELPAAAIEFALRLQLAIAAETWDDGIELRVRVAVHTGEAHHIGGAYLGEPLNRCGRIRGLGHGGQVLVSGTTAELVQDCLPASASLRGLGVHRLRDLARPERVLQLCHPQLGDEFAPLRSLDLLPNNLPLQLTTFIGRAAELEEGHALLGANRITTFTGAGGSGKTRLALQLAAGQLDAFIGGVWLVDLAPLTDAALVPHAISAAVGIAEVRLQLVMETLEEHLRDRQLLLILDNCEHLLDATATIADFLLRRCPNLVVLATSREPLGIEGEAVYRVPSLSLPVDGDDGDAEAVCLFADRARLARPAFRLDDATLPVVIAICRRLDGVPLAIELAAARVRSLSPHQIAEQIADRFALLSTGRRGAMARQRTLEASVEWSHSLLRDDESVLFRRLSVFCGGFTLAAAEAVCAGDGLDSWEILDLLSSLVDKSLVQFEDDPDNTRYRVLETIRFYARQRLVDSGELASTRDRHLEWCLTTFETLAPRLLGPAMAEGLASCESEVDNLRSALDWAEERPRSDVLLRMGAALGMFWLLRHPSEGYRRLTTALELGGQQNEDAWVQTVSFQVQIGFYMGHLHEMIQLAETMLDLGRRTGNSLATGRGLNLLGWDGMFGASRRSGAYDYFTESLPHLLQAGDAWYAVDAYCGLAMIHLAVGRTDEAGQAATAGLKLAQAAGNPMFAGWALALIGTVALRRGELDRADAAFAEAAHAVAAIGGDDLLSGWIAAGPLEVMNARGLFAEAKEAADRNLEMTVGQHNVFGTASTLWTRTIVEHRSRPPGAELESAARCEQLMTSAGVIGPIVWCQALRAEQALGRGDIARARALADEAVANAASDPAGRQARQRALLASARIARQEGARAVAEDSVHQVLSYAHRASARLQIPECLELLSLLAGEQESFAEAARLLGAAHVLRDRLGYPIPPVEQPDHATATRTARAGLGDSGFDDAWQEGAAMDLDAAVAYAQRGRGSRKRPSSGWESLTPTEIEVAELAATGLRNGDIASRLFVSPATVKTHLAHIFTKLGVRSRAELANLVVRR
jgi:predicted ATPase/class 3 adenylate cyclase/DNA-binding CsgD family transcriptional regulator